MRIVQTSEIQHGDLAWGLSDDYTVTILNDENMIRVSLGLMEDVLFKLKPQEPEEDELCEQQPATTTPINTALFLN